jgi:uncharacterized protein (DUF302 family)
VTAPVRTVPVERHEFLSAKPFDEVLAAVRAGLGHPDFAALEPRLASETDWDSYQATVAAETGTSGLMVFLELDLGGVVMRDPAGNRFREVRIIAGNPVTMSSLARTTPEAGAFAPVTILLFERPDAVHLRYDTLYSSVGDELDVDARAQAKHLDDSVLSLLAGAA